MRLEPIIPDDEKGLETFYLERVESADKIERSVANMLLALVHQLESGGPVPTLFWWYFKSSRFVTQELLLSATNVRFLIRVDWYDYRPLVNGLPAMHYRMDIRPSRGKGGEVRSEKPGEIERAILAAIDWPEHG